MNYQFLDQSKHKLARVEKFLDELDCEIKQYQEQKPAKLVFDDKTDPGWVVMKAEISAYPQVAIPLAIGDAIHNMRSALDILVCDLVRRTGTTPGTKVMYPFCSDEASLDDMIKQRGLANLPQAEIDIIKNSRPFKGGNENLRAVHDLDIADKHKLLLTSVTTAMATNVNAYEIGGRHVISDLGGLIVREGVGMFKYRVNSGLYFTMEPELSVDLLLEGCPAPGDLRSQLRALLQCVRSVVEAFA